ncbi:hypothetical protein VN0530_15070 [Helicobacter pylori]
MHKHTIYLRGNTLYLNYTKNSKRHRTSLNKLIKRLNLSNNQALEHFRRIRFRSNSKNAKTEFYA